MSESLAKKLFAGRSSATVEPQDLHKAKLKRRNRRRNKAARKSRRINRLKSKK